MNVDNETARYRIAQLPVAIAAMVEDFAETLADARKLSPTFVPLRLLDLVREVGYELADLDEIIEVAIRALPNSTDSDPARATLKGANALRRQLSAKVWELTGLVTLHMQTHANDGHEALAKGNAEETPEAVRRADHEAQRSRWQKENRSKGATAGWAKRKAREAKETTQSGAAH